MDDTQLLKNILAAQVLILAKQIKAEKKSNGVTSTSDFTNDAIRLIEQKKVKIYQTLQL